MVVATVRHWSNEELNCVLKCPYYRVLGRVKAVTERKNKNYEAF